MYVALQLVFNLFETKHGISELLEFWFSSLMQEAHQNNAYEFIQKL